MNENQPPPVPGSQIKTSGLAVTSLILGILAIVLTIVCIGPLLAIPAIICGHLAVSRIRRSGGMQGGKGLAIAGFSTGYASLALALLIVPLAIPNFVKAREQAMVNLCRNNLRQLEAAKQRWMVEKGKSPNDTPTQDELVPLLERGQFPICPAGGTYSINPAGQPPTCSHPRHGLREVE